MWITSPLGREQPVMGKTAQRPEIHRPGALASPGHPRRTRVSAVMKAFRMGCVVRGQRIEWVAHPPGFSASSGLRCSVAGGSAANRE